jgi:hypothetical protein
MQIFQLYHDETDHRICIKRNMTGALSGAGSVYPFGTHEFTPLPVFSWVQSSVFCVVFCSLLFVLFLLVMCCLSSDLRLLITPLVSSNFSHFRWDVDDVRFVLDQQA